MRIYYNINMKSKFKFLFYILLFISLFLLFSCDNHIHEYSSSKILKNATCTEDGIIEYSCNCGNSITEKIPSLSHNVSTKGNIKQPVTCTSDGIIEFCCTRCNEVINTETITAYGHDISVLLDTISPATCTNTGLANYQCSRCNFTAQKEIPLAAHVYTNEDLVIKAPTCQEAGIAQHLCTNCGIPFESVEIFNDSAHIKGDWIITKEPEYFYQGEKEVHCTLCDALLDSDVVDRVPFSGDWVWINNEDFIRLSFKSTNPNKLSEIEIKLNQFGYFYDFDCTFSYNENSISIHTNQFTEDIIINVNSVDMNNQTIDISFSDEVIYQLSQIEDLQFSDIPQYIDFASHGYISLNTPIPFYKWASPHLFSNGGNGNCLECNHERMARVELFYYDVFDSEEPIICDEAFEVEKNNGFTLPQIDNTKNWVTFNSVSSLDDNRIYNGLEIVELHDDITRLYLKNNTKMLFNTNTDRINIITMEKLLTNT